MMNIRLRDSSKSWIWYQHLPENMERNFGNMRLLSHNKIMFGYDFDKMLFLISGGPGTIGVSERCK